jgi:hypothetical protein
MLTFADVCRWVIEAIAESGATSASMMGKVMGVLMKKHKGDMDGGLAKTIAEDIFKNGGPSAAPAGAHFTCFTKYKSTNTDTWRSCGCHSGACRQSVYLLYWYKSANTDT